MWFDELKVDQQKKDVMELNILTMNNNEWIAEAFNWRFKSCDIGSYDFDEKKKPQLNISATARIRLNSMFALIIQKMKNIN